MGSCLFGMAQGSRQRRFLPDGVREGENLLIEARKQHQGVQALLRGHAAADSGGGKIAGGVEGDCVRRILGQRGPERLIRPHCLVGQPAGPTFLDAVHLLGHQPCAGQLGGQRPERRGSPPVLQVPGWIVAPGKVPAHLHPSHGGWHDPGRQRLVPCISTGEQMVDGPAQERLRVAGMQGKQAPISDGAHGRAGQLTTLQPP